MKSDTQVSRLSGFSQVSHKEKYDILICAVMFSSLFLPGRSWPCRTTPGGPEIKDNRFPFVITQGHTITLQIFQTEVH